MRNRTVMIHFRLNEQEAEHFNELVRKSGLTKSIYLRHLINGCVPKEAPPQEYFDMMKQLHGIGNNLHQLRLKAQRLNVANIKRYEEAEELFYRTIRLIMEAVILPQPMD